MGTYDAIITPVGGKDPKSIGNRCALIANPPDIDYLRNLTQITPKQSRRWLLSRIYYKPEKAPEFSIVGPFIGSPYAVMLLETAVVWGVKEVVFFGWCGSVSPNIQIGDIIVPDSAYIDEGTSKNYADEDSVMIKPSLMLQDKLKKALRHKKVRYHEGPIWTTDAIFRETSQKIAYYQKNNALAVEMEASALFSAGRFRSVSVGCILVVSDELRSGKWVRGFNNPGFKTSRNQAAEAVGSFLTDNFTTQ